VSRPNDLIQGTLDLLVLKMLALNSMNGWDISQRLKQISKDALDIPQGSLYPALYRLEHQGLIEAEWGESDNNRKAKFYTLTAAGRKRLKEETAGWLLAIHVALMLAALAGLTLAAALAALYLWQERRLKQRDVGVLRLRLPPLESLDRLSARTAAVSLSCPSCMAAS